MNGKFTQPQREIYELVLKAQKRAIELLVPGNSIKLANDEVIRIKTQGLVDLGILKGDVDKLIEEKAYRQFYMHGLGHWLGLDVHDVGRYDDDRSRTLEVGWLSLLSQVFIFQKRRMCQLNIKALVCVLKITC